MATMHQQRAAAADRPVVSAHEPAIDHIHLYRMTLGDHGLEREVLALFDRQIDLLIDRMRAVDASCVPALAHTLKGSARGVGAWPMARAAEAVEAAPAADLALAVAALAAMARETHEAIADLLGAA
jgi:HPt (histidine-containing phosphotransfer) domain-containing protein